MNVSNTDLSCQLPDFNTYLNTYLITGFNTCERQRGEELLRWQAQERMKRLQPLRDLLADLAGRLITAHPTWIIQEQLHLEHAGLEVAVRLGAGVILVECRPAEGLQWLGTGAMEVTVVSLSAPHIGAVPQIGMLPKVFAPNWSPLAMGVMASEIARDLLALDRSSG